MTVLDPTWSEAHADELDEQADTLDDRADEALAPRNMRAYAFVVVDGLPVPQETTTAGNPSASRSERAIIADASMWRRQAASLRRDAEALRDAAARDGGVTTPPQPGAISIESVPALTSVELTWILAAGGGSDTSTVIREVSPGTTHGTELLAGVRTWTAEGLTPGTTYTWDVTVIGPGGEAHSTISDTTLPEATAPGALSFAGTATFARADNSGTVTVTTPTGAVAGETLLFTFSRDTGVVGTSTLGPTATLTEIASARVGTVTGDHVARTYLLPLAAAPAASYGFKSDALDSSTIVSCVRISGGAVQVVAAAVTASTGTDSSIDAPSVEGRDGGLLVCGASYAPSPNPTTGRTNTPPAGMVELIDTSSPLGYHYQTVAGDDLTVDGPTGTKTFVASPGSGTPVLWSNAWSVSLAPAGGQPTVDPFVPTVTNPDGATTRIAGVFTGNFDSGTLDVEGDSLAPVIVAGAGSYAYTQDFPRPTGSSSQVYITFRPKIGTQQAPTTGRWGPFTIPAAAGGGTLPTRTAQTGPARITTSGTLSGGVVANVIGDGRPGIKDKVISGVPWNLGARASVIEFVDGDKPGTSCGVIRNCTADGGTEGAQGLFCRSADVQDLLIRRNGGAVYFPGDPNPANGHGLYGGSGFRFRRVTIQESLDGEGSYSWHWRRGDGVEFNFEAYDMVDLTGRNGVIGGAPIRRLLWDGGEKLGGGEFVLGGLSGGTHYEAEIRNMDWNRVRIMGDWRVRLAFVNCTARQIDDRSTGNKPTNIGQPASGLTRV